MKKIIISCLCVLFLSVGVSIADLPTTPIAQLPTEVTNLPAIVKVKALEFASSDRTFRRFLWAKIATGEVYSPIDSGDPQSTVTDVWYLESCVLLFLSEASYAYKMAILDILGLDRTQINLGQAAGMATVVATELAARRGIMQAYIKTVN